LYNWCLKQWFIPSNCVITKKSYKTADVKFTCK
jgi:hypothetical protein